MPTPADFGAPCAYPQGFYPGQVYPSQQANADMIKNYLAAYGPDAYHVTPNDFHRSLRGRP